MKNSFDMVKVTKAWLLGLDIEKTGWVVLMENTNKNRKVLRLGYGSRYTIHHRQRAAREAYAGSGGPTK